MVLDSTSSRPARMIAIPALRGQSLSVTINGRTYNTPVSEGDHCDAFDGATDDVLAFLNLIEQKEGKADVTRTGVRGGSRGGTVALLAGVRDARVKRVVGIVSPTNMLELTAEHENDATYQCQFLSSYKGGISSIAETRKKMLSSSPIFFVQHLPLVELHMGLKDGNVPIKQGYDIETKIDEIGNSARFRLFTYDKGHADIATNNPELAERIESFLSQL
jgi:dipeptidyl aminopeptidase/acylaminoacyl peptidase